MARIVPRIVIAECTQEISSFNPMQSGYENFAVQRGEGMFAQRGLNTAIGGMLDVLERRADVAIAPTMSARSGSAGLSAAGWTRLFAELQQAIRPAIAGADATCVSLAWRDGRRRRARSRRLSSGGVRGLAGPDMPIVISLDLHGIVTDRMLRQIAGVAIYHTYPHVDFANRRPRRAAAACASSMRLTPITARVRPRAGPRRRADHPTGCYGDLVRAASDRERGPALAAGV